MKDKKAGDAADAAQLARLYRYAADVELSSAARAELRGVVLGELKAMSDTPEPAREEAPRRTRDEAPRAREEAPRAREEAPRRREEAPRDTGHREPPPRKREEAPRRSRDDDRYEDAPRRAAAERAPSDETARMRPSRETTRPSQPTAKTKAPRTPEPPRVVERIELKIRQLVEAEAPWDELENHAWDLYVCDPVPEKAARVVELAFLHGSTEQTEQVLLKLKSKAKDFYRHVHPAVRAHLIVRLWREGAAESLASLVYRDREEDYLQPIERLYALVTMSTAKDQATPYIYFRRHRRALFNAAVDMGVYVGFTPGRFLLMVGQMAIDLGHDGDARELLAQIRPEDPEHDDALRALLNAAVDKNKAGRSHYSDALLKQTEPLDRIRLLSEFLSATRGLGGFKDRNRPALNELLRAPLEWLTEEPEVWSTLSELLVANRDLEPLLPNLFEVFKQHALKFQNPLVDSALWQGPMKMRADTARDRYWHAVALLHHYIAIGVNAEKSLWEARDTIVSAKKTWRQPLPFEWKELHKAATAWVAKNHYLLEPERQRMQQQLRIALDHDVVATSDLDEYLQYAETPPYEVLGQLQKLAEQKAAPALESRIILKRAQVTHLTNDDLARLWDLANLRRETDLAWRVATCLHARQRLVPSVKASWEISGEKRKEYSFIPPSKEAVERVLKDFSPRVRRLAYATLHVGPVLPELLAILDPGASVSRIAAPKADSIEAKVEKMLGELSWLMAPKKRYRFSYEAALGGTQIPAFMQVLPTNAWSVLVARLADRLGMNAWGWKLSRLHDQIVDLIPRLASRQDAKRHTGAVSSWLKKLTPDQRSAWQDMATLSRALDDERAADALAIFVCRLATVMFQNHYMALTSLQSMRANATVIWDLENWILSENYGDIRKRLKTHATVPVPNALQRLRSIVAQGV